MELCLTNGHVVDSVNRIDEILDVRIVDGKIAEVGRSLPMDENTLCIDCSGLTVIPGVCDMHIHMRDPGQTEKEDIFTASESAAAGGVTAVACMPNTTPPVDCPETVKYILDKAKSAKAKVYPIGSITKGLSGAELTDFAELKLAGCVGVSDDGKPVKNAMMMKTAIKNAALERLTIISHCEDLDIIDGGIMNMGAVSDVLGIKGMARSSENYITAREIFLAEEQGLPIHIAHVSTKEAVDIIRHMKKSGAKVTCETAPHYFTLTEDKLFTKDADYRMNPPLREQADVDAIIEGICDGTVDCIVTDHAPHTKEQKEDFYTAPNGVVGLETSLAVTVTALLNTGKISHVRLVELMCVNPRRILGISGGDLSVGSDADITIFSENEQWTVQPEKLQSKSKNTCFKGMTLSGKVKYTLLNGKIVYRD
ncbi:MAG: dihydroorotase [Ruminiclostridium sp.]|jgi:dihydroorotase|nr:dihydroorotase [Ruminiclostridium sp.]